jgi:hypothetical protein
MSGETSASEPSAFAKCLTAAIESPDHGLALHRHLSLHRCHASNKPSINHQTRRLEIATALARISRPSRVSLVYVTDCYPCFEIESPRGRAQGQVAIGRRWFTGCVRAGSGVLRAGYCHQGNLRLVEFQCGGGGCHKEALNKSVVPKLQEIVDAVQQIEQK